MIPRINSSKKKSRFYPGIVIAVPGIFLGELVSALASFRALVGGGSSDALRVGALALRVSAAVSYVSWSVGAALSCEQPLAA